MSLGCAGGEESDDGARWYDEEDGDDRDEGSSARGGIGSRLNRDEEAVEGSRDPDRTGWPDVLRILRMRTSSTIVEAR